MTNSDLPTIYLAGKIDGADFDTQLGGEFRDWRWPIVGVELFNYSSVYESKQEFYYSGPFYIPEKSHFGFQDANNHGAGANSYLDNRALVVYESLKGIDNCDIVFAWLNTKDAHGTLMEIAYACSRYKDITIVVPPCDCDTTDCPHDYEPNHTCVQMEVWFAQSMVKHHHGNVIYSNDPVEEFYKMLARFNRVHQKFNSVPEKQFWTRVIDDPEKGLLYNKIVPQQPVGKYRIDFAIPELKFGIEIDGLAYHNGQDSFMKDRSRQREIESQGWRIVRFAAKEISLDVDKCFQEAENIARQLSQATELVSVEAGAR